MSRRNQARALLQAGLGPADIGTMGISAASVIQYLRTCVGEGSLRFSDIYFGIPEDRRRVLQEVAGLPVGGTERGPLMKQHQISQEELDLFLSLRKRKTFAGDLYEYITDIEIILHQVVRNVLAKQFTDSETHWWRAGVPQEIRKKCVTRREEDEDYHDAFSYTDLIDIYKIIDENRRSFVFILPKEYIANRNVFKRDFMRLNRIRNAIMHPVKHRKWFQEDFSFVREMALTFQEVARRADSPIPSQQPVDIPFDANRSVEVFRKSEHQVTRAISIDRQLSLPTVTSKDLSDAQGR